MQIYDTDEEGNIIILYDSRWQHPELLGHKKDSEEYKSLRKLWEERSMGRASEG